MLFSTSNFLSYSVILKSFSIDSKGCYVDNILVNDQFNINDLNIFDSSTIRLKIGFKKDAIHLGGVNLFGKNFGNYAQDIVMTISKDNYYDL